jgi:acetyltransferase-like isoleucine patch superfamily enzyme
MNKAEFKTLLEETINFKANQFHPLVWINGKPEFGQGVYIGGMSEINANGAKVIIGDNCDIASFVAINCADSHKKCIGLSDEVERKDIIIENNVFIGSHCVIKGGAFIGHHSVVAAGTIVEGVHIPPYSLIIGNPMKVKEAYYINELNASSKNHTAQ